MKRGNKNGTLRKLSEPRTGNFLDVRWLTLHAFKLLRAWVRSLVGKQIPADHAVPGGGWGEVGGKVSR